MKQIYSLSNFQLFYEEMERKLSTAKKTSTSTAKQKAVATADSSVTLKKQIIALKKALIAQFDNILKKLGIQRKKAKKLTKDERKLAHLQKMRGIIGIGLLFVVVSIAYSTYMTNLFVDGSMMVVALAPQVVFAITILLIAFYKIYK